MKRWDAWAAMLAAALVGVSPQPGRAQAPRRAAPLVSPEVHPDGKVTFHGHAEEAPRKTGGLRRSHRQAVLRVVEAEQGRAVAHAAA